MKHCGRCQQTKPIHQFSFKNIKRGLRLSYCRDCNKDYQRNHYKLHLADYKAKSVRYKSFIRRENRNKILEYLKDHPCIDCGEADYRVLEFDHVRGRKREAVSILHNDALSWKTLLEEIKKCEVRCANCHKRRTAVQFGWYENIKKTARSSIG